MVNIRAQAARLACSGEVLTVAALLPNMATGQPLAHDLPTDPHLLGNLPKLQDIFNVWFEELSPVNVNIPARGEADGGKTTGRVATFFSGGVDSFHTLLSHVDEITDIIFVHGFDIDLDDHGLRAQSSAMVQAVGERLAKNVIEIETDLRSAFDQHIGWGASHGAALAVIGHALSEHFDKVYIPASHTYQFLFPWGSHPLVDPLWSSQALAFVHDGAEHRRTEKIAHIAQHSVALDHLRVCWHNLDQAYNCGRCEKCVRTMVALKAEDALERCRTLPDDIKLADVRTIEASKKNIEMFLEENIAALREAGENESLVAALETALKGRSWLGQQADTLQRAADRPHLIMPALKRRWRALTGQDKDA